MSQSRKSKSELALENKELRAQVSSLIHALAAAVAAERESCAVVAAAHGKELTPEEFAVDYLRGTADCAHDIAAAIRARGARGAR